MSEPKVFPHQFGDTVSTASRFSEQDAYLQAVESQKKEPYLSYDTNSKGTSCSFKLPDYTEVLLMWQQDNLGYPTNCRIKYVYVDKTVPGLWIKYHLLIAKGRYSGLEDISESLPGVNDEMNNSRRVVFKDTQKPLRAELDGYIINPPYPPFVPHSSLAKADTQLIAAGVIVGIGVLVWLIVRRRRFS